MAPPPSTRSARKEKPKLQIQSESESESSEDVSSSEDEAQEVEQSEAREESESEEEPKDETELELERLLFGDSAGFRDQIRSFGNEERGLIQDVNMDEAEDEEEDERGLGGLADGDLFFVDSEPTDGNPKAIVPAYTNDEDGSDDGREPPAWEDSDDERMSVSLAAVPRLRKLRRTEAEDVVSGKEYSKRLRAQFERLNPPPEWAQIALKKTKRKSTGEAESGDESSGDDDIDIDLSAQPLAKLLKDSDALSRWQGSGSNKRRKLAPEKIAISRLKDIDGEQPSAVSSLSFHPTYPLLLSSGLAKTVWLHHIYPYPPLPNPLLTSLHIKGTPLDTTSFHPDPNDNRIFMSSRRRFFHVWNLSIGQIDKVDRLRGYEEDQQSMDRFVISPNGQYIAFIGKVSKNTGIVNILSTTTMQFITQARIESKLADFAWWTDGNGLSIVGTGGEVAEYNVVEQRFAAIWQDEGALNTTTIALGGRSGRDNFFGGDRWVAIGSASGIVNIYDRRAWLPHNAASKSKSTPPLPPNPTPLKTIDNLVTSITSLKFSPDGQVLALASQHKRDALRLLHLPSCTVYQNWPTQSTPLGRITAVAWGNGEMLEESEGDGEGGRGLPLYVLAVGNERGKIRLWEVGIE